MLVSVFGLAFSRDFQCIALLVFPYLTASRVRWLIVFYTTGVSVTGPGLNFLHNSGNFRNSIACVIAQVNTNMMILKKLTQAPFALFKSQLENLIGSINSIVERFRQTLSKINFSLIRLTNVMESQASWIHSLIVACGDSVALINQCLAFFNNIYFSCKKAFGFLSGLYVFTELCKKQGAVLEDTLNVTSKTELANQIHGILNVIGRKNLTLSGNLSAIQEITFSSDHTISNKLQQRMDSFIQTVDAVKYIVSWVMVAWTLITMMTLFVQAIMFRRSWLNNDAYNNVYITSAFIEQEKEAIRKGLVPTVPLVRKEKKIYKKLSSISWTLSEKHTAMLASIMLIIWSSSIILVMVTDYAMYTVTDIVIPLFSHDFSKYGSGGDTEEGSRIEDDENYKLHIDGDSSFANIIQSLTGMLNPLKDVALNIDATTCRPTPNPPDFNTYIEIILLLLLAFISVILQVYIMRLRHSIMIWYYPKKAVHRAAWLRTHIKNNRGLYHRIIHKFKTLDIKRNRRAQNISYLGRYLSRHRRIANLLRLLGIQRIMCVFCGSDGNPSKRSEFEENLHAVMTVGRIIVVHVKSS
uniref:Dendritic cell-specific transmembrane protein-like domain-containing protein n=1 Tax=Trichobilharzia regenti TaxID=157069 RepID=A0AA85K5Y1_TRIRE|nr:unnamed protein product [Trichobilharzia regenti]